MISSKHIVILSLGLSFNILAAPSGLLNVPLSSGTVSSQAIVTALGFVPGTGNGNGGTGISTNSGSGTNNPMTGLIIRDSFSLANGGATNSANRIVGSSLNGYSTNTYGAGPYGFSYNLSSLRYFQKRVSTNDNSIKILCLGDSVGGDIIYPIAKYFSSNYVFGISPLLEGQGDFTATGYGSALNVEYDTNWWGTEYAISNTATHTYGIRNSFPVPANSLRFWYMANAAWGSIQIQVSPAASSNTWSTVAVVDTSIGSNLKCTNISLLGGSYYLRLSNSISGSENRSVYMWPQLRQTGSKAIEFFDGHVGGHVLSDFLTMGTNSIASLLTNYNPDIIFYTQKKDVVTMDYWTNVAALFKTYATNSDVVIVQGYPSGEFESIPANGTQFQRPVQREVAQTNDWTFIDAVTPYPWTNVTERAGFTNGSDAIHFGFTGRESLGNLVLNQLHLDSYLQTAGKFKPLQLGYASVFDPLQISSMQVWYDPDTCTNRLNGTAIQRLVDQGPNKLDAVGSLNSSYWTNNVNHINGYGWLQFDTASNLGTNFTAIPQPTTVFVLCNPGKSAGYVFDSVNSAASTRNAFGLINASTTLDQYAGTEVQKQGSWTNGFALYECYYNGASSYVKANGRTILSGDVGSGTMAGLRLGSAADGGSKGDAAIAQFMEYNKTLTTGETAKLYGWFRDKYGISAIAPQLIVNTNAIVLGTRYTNGPARAFVAASFTLTAAAAGTAAVTLVVENNVTNKLSVSAGPLASLITVEPLGLPVSPNGVYIFTDATSGAGASAAFFADSFSLTSW